MVQRARRRQEIEIIKRIYFGFLPVPWILAALLFVNGKFDTTTPRTETVAVVGKFSVSGLFRSRRLEVTSWREGHQIERLSVAGDDYDRFHVDDMVVVEMGEGVAGIPWVAGVHRP